MVREAERARREAAAARVAAVAKVLRAPIHSLIAKPVGDAVAAAAPEVLEDTVVSAAAEEPEERSSCRLVHVAQ